MEWTRRRGTVLAAVVGVLLAGGAVVSVVDGGSNGTATRTSGAAGEIRPLAGRSAGGSAGARERAAPAETTRLQPADDGGASLVPTAQPEVIKAAEVSVEVKRGSFLRAFRAASTVATGNGGFVSESSQEPLPADEGDEGTATSGSLTLRVPADRFDAARAALGELGTVTAERIDGDEVGDQLVDLGARLRTLQAHEDALRVLMGKATTVAETMQVQQQVFQVRQEAEQLAARQANLEHAVALATIRVTLSEPEGAGAAEEGATGLARDMRRALDGAAAVVGGTLVLLGYLVPLGGMTLLLWAGYRAFRRRAPAHAG